MTFSMIIPIAVSLLGPAETPASADDAAAGADAPGGALAPAPGEGAPAETPPTGPDPSWDAVSSPTGAAPATEPAAPPAETVAPEPAPLAIPAAMDPPPPPPRPIRWRLDFGLGGGTTVVSDLGYRAFAERRNLTELAVSTVFDFRLAEGRVFLGGGLAYHRSNNRGDVYRSSVGAGLSMQEPQILGRVSVMTIEGLDVFARLGVGPSVVELDFDSRNGAVQSELIPRVDGQAGLSLYLPKAWLPRKQASRLSAGLQLGMGYTWRGVIDVQPELFQDDDPLRASTSSWGELSMHGVSWGASLFLRVM